MINVEAKPCHVNLLHQIGRTVTSLPFRGEMDNQAEGIIKAERLVQHGYGLIIAFNHMSKGDPPQVIKNVVFKNKIFNKKPIVLPIAFHENKIWFNVLQGMTNGKLMPIVTQSTIDLGKNKGRELNDGLKEYFNEAVAALGRGEIVLIAPQGTRQSSLGSPERPAIGTLLASAAKHKINRFALLVVGVNIQGASSYKKEDVGGLNLGKKYILRPGECFTYREIMEHEGVQGKFRQVDNLIFAKLSEVVPSAYV